MTQKKRPQDFIKLLTQYLLNQTSQTKNNGTVRELRLLRIQRGVHAWDSLKTVVSVIILIRIYCELIACNNCWYLQVWLLSLYRNDYRHHSFHRISRIDPSLNLQKCQLSHGTIVFGLRCMVQKIWCQEVNKILRTFFLSHPVDKIFTCWSLKILKCGFCN